MSKCLVIFAGLLVASLSEAHAHPYFPLKEGLTLKFNYSFQVETDRKEFKQGDTKGSITTRATKWEERGGHRVLRFVASYQDIPFMKQDAVLWRREEAGVLYVGQENNKGEYQETIELPADCAVGSEWSYNDGVPSLRTIVAQKPFEITNGTKLEDCIEVSRKIIAKPGDKTLNNIKDVSDTITYCRDTGSVKTLFVQPSPIGPYRTETVIAARPTE